MKRLFLILIFPFLAGLALMAEDIEGTPLITDVSQLSSNASDWQEGQHLEYLIDEDWSTFWHTDWHGVVTDALHYLQVDLREQVKGELVLYMQRRNSGNDHPSEMRVEASNDAKTWTYLTTLDMPNARTAEESVSDPFPLDKAYRYLRFAATNCGGSAGYRIFWHTAEFQLYLLGSDGLPFRPTHIVDGRLEDKTRWYTMTIRDTKKIFTSGQNILCTSDAVLTPNHLWAFVGDEEQGFRLYNYVTGLSAHAYVPSSDNRTVATMVEQVPSGGTDLFMVSSNGCGGYNFHFPGVPEACLNDHAGSGVVALWNNVNSPNDGGSNIVFERIDPKQLTVYVERLQLSQTSATVYPGDSLQLTCQVFPENATFKELWWSSSNPGVATVDNQGKVTAVGSGKTIITAEATDGSAAIASCAILVPEGTAFEPVEGSVRYFYFADGRVRAFPRKYLKAQKKSSTAYKLTLYTDETVELKMSELDSVSDVAPRDMPFFTSYKFNNKYNSQLPSDVQGEILPDNKIQLTVPCIGKRLTPSFKLSADDADAYIGTELQKSKVNRLRFEGQIRYVVARHGCTILRRTLSGSYQEAPLGTEYTVTADFPTDHPTGQYNVPVIHIHTNDGSMISSKSYYWDGTVSVDGSGVFPDLPKTQMQIKGRGNSSWAGTWGKSPYHLKFAEKTSMLGLKKGKHWNLIANAQNLSMLCNSIGMRVAQMVQTAASNHEIPVELYINDEYRGSYTLTEKVGFSNNSVDLEDETNAVLLELDSYYDETYKFRSSKWSLPVNIKEPDLSLATTELKKGDIQLHFNTFINEFYNEGNIADYVDVDYLARYLMVNELVQNYELMHPKSVFLYHEDIKNSDCKYIWGPVWDLDWAFGYEDSGTYFQVGATRDYWKGHSFESDAFIKKLRYSGEEMNKAYYRVWTDFMNHDLTELLEYCDDYYQYAAPSFTHDNSKWGRGDAWDYAWVTENAKEWLAARCNYIYSYLSNELGYAQKGYLEEEEKPTIGDVNEDGVVTTADVVCVLNHILGRENEDFCFAQADTDGNDLITIADAMYIQHLVGKQKANMKHRMQLAESEAALRLSPAVKGEEREISQSMTLLVEEENYSGIQFDVKLPEGMELSDIVLPEEMAGYSKRIEPLDNGGCRVSLCASADQALPEGKLECKLLMTGDDSISDGLLQVSLSNAMMATTTGEDERLNVHSAALDMNTTGLYSPEEIRVMGGNELQVESRSDRVLRIYTLDGRLQGIYPIHEGRNNVWLPKGVYLVNNQKIIIQ